MKKWKENWKALMPYERLFRAVGFVLAISVLVTSVLSLLQSLEILVFGWELMPFVLVLCSGTLLCQGIYTWRSSRGTAVFSLIAGAFVLLCCFVMFFMKRG